MRKIPEGLSGRGLEFLAWLKQLKALSTPAWVDCCLNSGSAVHENNGV